MTHKRRVYTTELDVFTTEDKTQDLTLVYIDRDRHGDSYGTSWYLSLCSVNTSTKFCTSHFLSVSVSISLSGSVNKLFFDIIVVETVFFHILRNNLSTSKQIIFAFSED